MHPRKTTIPGLFTAAAMLFSLTPASPTGAQIASKVAAGSGFPGDHGRPGNGLPMPADAPPPPPRPPEDVSPALPVDLAVDLAKAAVLACKGFFVGVSIIDASGKPKLYYVSDGASGSHAYTGFRKAYTALTFAVPTSRVATMSQTDPVVAARVVADPNLLTWAGGAPILAHGQLIGAIGVSGAEPSAADEACAQTALASIRGRLP